MRILEIVLRDSNTSRLRGIEGRSLALSARSGEREGTRRASGGEGEVLLARPRSPQAPTSPARYARALSPRKRAARAFDRFGRRSYRLGFEIGE